MKPRLGPAMLTEEDWLAWGYCLLRWSPGVVDLYGPSMDADRRDADLMLRCQQFRAAGFTGTIEATPLYPAAERLQMDGQVRPLSVFGGDITSCA